MLYCVFGDAVLPVRVGMSRLGVNHFTDNSCIARARGDEPDGINRLFSLISVSPVRVGMSRHNQVEKRSGLCIARARRDEPLRLWLPSNPSSYCPCAWG